MFPTLKTRDWFHPDGFPIAVERRDPQAPFGAHRHEFSEIVIIVGGRGWHVVGKESWPLMAGDVFVIGGPRAHEYRELADLRLINILFQPEKLRLEIADLPSLPGFHALFKLEPAWRKRHQFKSRLRLSPKELAVVIEFVDELDAELKARAAGFGFVATAWFMQIVGYLARCYSRTRNRDSRALLRIAEAITHLELHFEEPINLDAMAATAQMSKRSFLRAFHAAMGISPIAHLIRLRVNRAATLLRQSDDGITDIAFRVGYSDSNYFTRQFVKALGVSPREYRRRHARPAAPS